jgi:hypothetical protein
MPSVSPSVSSLDKDVKDKIALRATDDAANEVRDFIEESLGERLPGVRTLKDLVTSLKDGVALCKYESLTFW